MYFNPGRKNVLRNGEDRERLAFMLIECRVETLTESGWPEFTGSLNPLCLALGEKRQDAKPER
jgi:hypothetical protein